MAQNTMSDGIPSCTGLTAIWCPACGDCTCERLRNGEPCLNFEHCPLHSVHSTHADTVTLGDCQRRVSALAEDHGVKLTPHDHETIARFAQYLFDRSGRDRS